MQNNILPGLNKEIEKMKPEIEMFKKMKNKYIKNKTVLTKLSDYKVIDLDRELNS